MSLRLRLLLGLLVLLALGLAASDAVTYVTLRSSLQSRLQTQLLDSLNPARRCVPALVQHQFCPAQFPPLPGTYAALVVGGQVQDPVVFAGDHSAVPRIPLSLLENAGQSPTYFTVGSSLGGGDFQGVVLGGGPGGVGTVVAVPLTSLNATLDQLLLLELIASLGVLLATGLAGWWTIQIGLRPLRRIRDTAQTIAAGDLSQRVPSVNPHTEVGQLGVSLNEMLAQIEQAFAARTASEERLRQFVADASHELRTPLSSIRGYAELFRRGARSNLEDLGTAMSRIESESVRMTELVDDLLLLAHMDEGRALDLKPVDLTPLALDAAADQSAADRRHPIRVVAPDPVVVAGDEARLRQVVANLVRNAVVHTPDGTRVEIEVSREDQAGVLRVVDHGPGVPQEAAGRIFERFVREDRSRGRSHGGAGLGLAIVAAIVASHGGTVLLEDTPGGGATFRVELPLSGAPEPAQAPLPAEVPDAPLSAGEAEEVSQVPDRPGLPSSRAPSSR